jgi:hypothetical protein
MIQHALAPSGAKVTESTLASDPGTFGEREIDILIETAVGPYTIKIAVEAKHEGRKMDSTKFESILGKYLVEGGVKVNKIVIVTHHGFFQPVIDRAKQLRVDLFTLEQAKALDWASLLPQQLNFNIPPHLCGFGVFPEIPSEVKDDVLRNGCLTCVHGHNHGTLLNFLGRVFIPGFFRDNLTVLPQMAELAKNGTSGEAKADVSARLGHPMILSNGGQRFPVERIDFRIHLVSATGQMEYSLCRLNALEGETTELQLGEAIIAGKRIRLMMPNGTKSEKIVIRLDPV